MLEPVWEWIDSVQDVLTLVGSPVAVYLLIRICYKPSIKYRKATW